MRLSHRVYLFDNSQDRMKLVAEMTPDKTLDLKDSMAPLWLQHYVLDKLGE